MYVSSCSVKSKECPLEQAVLSQVPCPALACPSTFCHIFLFWWKVLTGDISGDMHFLGSLCGPADCGSSLGFASSSTRSKPGCGPGGMSKEKAACFCSSTKEEMSFLGPTDLLRFCLFGFLRLWLERWRVCFEIPPSGFGYGLALWIHIRSVCERGIRILGMKSSAE